MGLGSLETIQRGGSGSAGRYCWGQRRRGIISVAKQAESVSPSRQISSQPTTTTGHSLSAATFETRTSLVTVTEDKSLDYEDMSVDKDEDESPTEIWQILDELTDGFEDPTLLRLSEEDVVLDMDEVVVETEELEELYDSDDDGDSESGGLAGDWSLIIVSTT